MKNITAVYVRVSTSNKGQTTENQQLDLLKYCKQRGFEDPVIFDDSGFSGSLVNRPELDKMMNLVRSGEVKRVLVARFDRFARSIQFLLSALQEFKENEVDFISFGEGIDTSTSVGKMVFTFLGAIAEFEREILKERIHSGLRRARKNNIKLGRPRKGFDCELAIELRRKGLSFKMISKTMGVSVGKLHKFLKSADVQ